MGGKRASAVATRPGAKLAEEVDSTALASSDALDLPRAVPLVVRRIRGSLARTHQTKIRTTGRNHASCGGADLRRPDLGRKWTMPTAPRRVETSIEGHRSHA
jgi:hypothetical protein